MSRLFKRFLSVVPAVIIIAICFAAVAFGAVTKNTQLPENAAENQLRSISGNYDIGERTEEQIGAEWEDVKNDYSGSIYSMSPSVSDPYAAGAVATDYLNSTLAYVNYYRYLAKLPALALNTGKVSGAQHGAVLMAATKTLAHSISQPSGMNSDFYETANSALGASNLARYTGSQDNILRMSIDSYMRASDTSSTLRYAQHRRWVLSPYLRTTGFGLAEATDDAKYCSMYVFDDVANTTTYDYIAWPPSGLCPNNMIGTSDPWSISINPLKYKFNSVNSLKITITRESDDAVFNLTPAMSTPSRTQPYLVADKLTYAVPMTMVFSIGSDNHLGSTLWGTFEVKVEGLTANDGSAVTLVYKTRFFSVDGEVDDPTIPEPTTEEPTTEEPTTEEPTTEEPTTEEPTTEEPTTEEPTTEEPTTEEPTTEEPTEPPAQGTALVAANDSTAQISDDTGYITGIAVGTTYSQLENEYLQVIGNGHIECIGGSVIGTGSVILLRDENNQILTFYTIVIFGDLNGDGLINMADENALAMHLSGSSHMACDSASYFAADISGDGLINQADRTVLNTCLNGSNIVNQLTGNVE